VGGSARDQLLVTFNAYTACGDPIATAANAALARRWGRREAQEGFPGIGAPESFCNFTCMIGAWQREQDWLGKE